MITSMDCCRPSTVIVSLLLCFAMPAALIAQVAGEPLPLNQSTDQGPVRVTMLIDRNQIQIADPFDLKIIVEAPDEVGVSFPEMNPGPWGDFNLVAQQQGGPIPIIDHDSPNRFTKSATYRIESLKGDVQKVPSIQINIVGLPGTDTIQTDSISLRIDSIVPEDQEPTQFRDLKPMRELTESDGNRRSRTWVLLSFALLIVIAAFVAKRYSNSPSRQRKRWKATVDQVQASHVNQAMGLSESHDEVCGIVRQWIQWQQAIPATRQSTDQLISQLRENELPTPVIQRISKILNRNDLLKFSAGSISVDVVTEAKQTRSDADMTESRPHASELATVFEDSRWLMDQDLANNEVSK